MKKWASTFPTPDLTRRSQSWLLSGQRPVECPLYLKRGSKHHLIGGTTKSDGRAVAAMMNGTEIRRLNAEDAAEYQAVFLEALQSAPAAFAADYDEESARSSDQIAERFRREVVFGVFVDGRLCAIATFLQQPSPKRRHVGMIWNM